MCIRDRLDQALLAVEGKRHRKASSNRLTPEIAPQGGFKKTMFCQQIRREGNTGSTGSKVNPSGPRPGRGDVAHDLGLEVVDRGKPHLLSQALEEVQAHPSTIEIA